MVDSILDVKNLSGGYDDLLVVRDISLEIHSGQAISITGRNGVGKSTLLKLIFGNLKPYQGEVNFLNSNLEKIASHRRLDLGCLLYTSPSPRDRSLSRMPSSA